MQRAAYQTIISRKSCFAPPLILPDPTKFRWKREEIELRAVSVFRKTNQAHVERMNRIRIRTQKKLLLMNIPLTVKAPKIILIQAKVMKIMKTDIYAISNFITNFKSPKRFGLKYLYYIFPHNVCSDVYLFILILIFIRYVPRKQQVL